MFQHGMTEACTGRVEIKNIGKTRLHSLLIIRGGGKCFLNEGVRGALETHKKGGSRLFAIGITFSIWIVVMFRSRSAERNVAIYVHRIGNIH